MEENFETLWEQWKAEYKKQRTGYNKNIWANINQHPLDKALDNLAMLYLASSKNQKGIIGSALFRKVIEPWDLVLYIRRAGMRLTQQGNEKVINWAFQIALLSCEFEDPRDIFVSLTLLVVGAEKAGIRIEDYFKSISKTSDERTKEIFNDVLQQPNAGIDFAINKFGPPEWRKSLP